MNKPSKELVVDLINEASGRDFDLSEVTFDNPTAVNIHGKNTEVVVRGVPETGYVGARVLHYDRLALNIAMPPAEPEGVEVMVPNDGFIDTGEISERLNRMYGLQLAPEDFVYQELDIQSLPMSLTLQANPNSLAWRASMGITLVQDRPMFNDAVTDHNLDGFEVPSEDVSHLTDPAVAVNAQVFFRTGSDLDMEAGIPASGFSICANGELELAACARRLDGTVASTPDPDGSYSLALNGYATWCIPLSIGLVASGGGIKITDVYAVTLTITCPDNSVVTFTLEYDETEDRFELLTSGATIIPADYSGVDGDVFQHLLDMKSIESLLGSVMNGPGGAPLGLYTVRLQARRLNSMAPRVLTTFLVKANNGT